MFPKAVATRLIREGRESLALVAGCAVSLVGANSAVEGWLAAEAFGSGQARDAAAALQVDLVERDGDGSASTASRDVPSLKPGQVVYLGYRVGLSGSGRGTVTITVAPVDALAAGLSYGWRAAADDRGCRNAWATRSGVAGQSPVRVSSPSETVICVRLAADSRATKPAAEPVWRFTASAD